MGLVRFIGKLFSPFSRHFSPSPEPGENEQQWLGREGERLAARWLRRRGYKILYQNFRGPRGGEIDLVCRHRDTLVFLEVKTRRSSDYGTPGAAVTPDKQKQIARGGLAWLHLLHNPEIIVRFDVVEVVITDSKPQFNLITDAFTLPEPWIY